MARKFRRPIWTFRQGVERIEYPEACESDGVDECLDGPARGQQLLGQQISCVGEGEDAVQVVTETSKGSSEEGNGSRFEKGR